MKEKKPKWEKSTNAEMEIRIATVYEMLLRETRRRDIVRFASEEWNISSRQVDEYIARARAEIEKEFGPEYRKKKFEKQLAKLSDLYSKNHDIGDYKECRSVIEVENKMLGLNEPEKHELNTAITWNITKTYEADEKTDDSV